MENRRKEGQRKEQTAEAYLTGLGYEILERNYRCRQGEIDLIGRDGRCLVFIEVKYRKNSRFGLPAEAVDRRKQNRIIYTARHYLMSRGYSSLTPCRFDVVSILGSEITVLKDAFSL